MKLLTTGRRLIAASTGLAITLALAGQGFAQDKVNLSFLVDNLPDHVAVAQQLIKDFEAANPGITLELETRLGGTDGDNIVKTQLATGDMDDVFLYNSGSLFQVMNPEQNLVDLTNEPWQSTVLDSFKKVVSTNGKIYGAPIGTAMGGGVIYNRKIYADLSLSVPKTWAEFMANNEKIKAAGKTAVIQTFGDSWTAQLFVLGDFYNVLQADPNFADEYTANKVKFATTPAAVAGFLHQVDVFKGGYLNADAGAAKYEDGIKMVASGQGAHYPMLTQAISVIQKDYADNVKDIGFFALPGSDAAKNGVTVWEPNGLYIPKSSPHVDAAKKFLAFVASKAGCDSQIAAAGVTGPFVVKGCELPKDVPPAIADLNSYFQKDGATAPALEFLSPVKGPNLSQITVEVGLGIRPASDGASLYDDDVTKQAQQLGLAGW